MMDSKQREAVAAISLMAAMADGQKSDVEREHLKRTFALIAGEEAIDKGGIYYRVLLKQTDLKREAARFSEPEHRQFVYEMALGVCDADGHASPAERMFLETLRGHLGLDVKSAGALVDQADAIADAPIPLELSAGGSTGTGVEETGQSVRLEFPPVATGAVAGAAAGAVAGAAAAAGTGAAPPPIPSQAVKDEINASALRYAILTAAIELLPQNLATVAIIPLQSKMVYEVGKRHGFTLDRRHIVDFLGVVGISMTGQVIEGYARKLMGNLGGMLGGSLGGMLGKSIGKTGKDLGKRGAQAMTSATMTFATTYALAQVASVYYANNRTLPAAQLKEAFREQVNRATGLFPQHQAEVERRSQTINVADLPGLIRGQVM